MNNNNNLGVGKEVLSYCLKCKLTLAHLIVSMKTIKDIGKVECKTCKGTHAFKDPASDKPKSKISAIKKTGKPTKVEQNSNLWEKAMKDSKKTHIPYTVKAKFTLGDIITHPKFGEGVVDRILDTNKIEVVFKSEVKTLIHNT